MTFGVLMYLLIGLIWVRLEHDTFLEIEWEDDTAVNLFFNVAQQMLHYIRIILVWPLYALEDLLIWLENNRA